MKKILIALACGVVLLAAAAGTMYLLNSTPAVAAISSSETANPSKPYVVKLHARWCAVCMATKSMWSQIEATYGPRVNLLVLDFTTEATTDASRAEAKRLGLEKVFDEHGGWTGTILVLDARTREVTAAINGSRDFNEYRAAIDASLQAAAR